MQALHPVAVKAASFFIISLILLCLAWELWLAPLRPGGSWLVLKVIPLLLPLRGILHGRTYTYRWTAILTLAYFGEGLVRATSDRSPSSWCASAEVVLAAGLFVAIFAAIRLTPRRQETEVKPGD